MIKGKQQAVRKTVISLLLLCLSFAFVPVLACVPASGEETCEIVIENLTRGEEMPDLHAVEKAASRITQEKIGCTIRIENVPIADHARRMELNGISENRIDIINTGRTTPFQEMVAKGMLLPLDDLLEEYGPVIRSKASDLLPGCTLNGKIYCLPSNLYCSTAAGFLYNREIVERCGITMQEVMTADDLEKIAPVLKEYGIYLLSHGFGDTNLILFGILNPRIIPVDRNNYGNGVFSDETCTTIRNPFTSEEFLEYCRRMRTWRENGWIPSDSLISGKTVVDMFRDQEVFMTWIAVNPIDRMMQQKNYSFPIDMFSTSEDSELSTSQIHSSGWGVCAQSEHPEKAVQLLNLMYDDPELANLLMNGIEGREYVKISDHIISYPEGVTAETVGYSRRLSIFGDYMQVYQWYPATEKDYENLLEFSKGLQVSHLLGYTFDLTPVAAEYNAVTAVLSEYMPPLDCGVIDDVDSAVQNMNEELEKAGISRIIAENQRQLDRWRKENT